MSKQKPPKGNPKMQGDEDEGRAILDWWNKQDAERAGGSDKPKKPDKPDEEDE